jgi:signal transduction histidine kinase
LSASGPATAALPVAVSRPTTARRRLVELPVAVLVGLGVVALAAAVAGYLLGGRDATPGPVALTAVLACSCAPLGIFVLRRLPGHPLGRLMTFSGVGAVAATLAVCWSSWLPAAWLSQWAWWPPLAVLPLLLLLLPDGQPPSPRWRPLFAGLVAAAALSTVAFAVAALWQPRTLLSSGGFVDAAGVRPVLMVAVGAVGLVLVGTLAVLASLIVRWRRAVPLVRRQLACLAPSAALLAVGLSLDAAFNLPVAWLVAVASLPIGLTVAVLQYRLHDLDLYVHRGVVWAVLMGVAVGVYVAVVAALGAVFSGLTTQAASVVAAGVVAALLQPAERLVQRGVSRLLYGRRDEPYAVLAAIGRRLGGGRDPLDVLPEITAGLVDGLKVPYAAVRVAAEDGALTTAAEQGRWTGEPERFALVAHGRTVGELLVAPRREGTRFTSAETRLLDDVAGQTALLAVALRGAVALRLARDRLVIAREEERKTLRHELHDGVASSLAGTRMLTEAVRRTVPTSGSAPALLTALTADLDAAIGEIRGLIDGLRPAALDDGLRAALVAMTDRAAGHGLPVELVVDGPLTELPAAVEVAAYRIAAEAVANTIKHAGAASCTVTVRRDERHVEVEVLDDGAGLADAGSRGRAGVGLGSIRERAEELGGRVVMTGGPGGTRIQALLPLGL